MVQADIVIIGAGAIGGYLGVLLHDAGFRVRFLMRNSERSTAQVENLAQRGLTVTCSSEPGFQKSIKPQEISNVFTTDSKCLTECSHVFVATKRTQNSVVHKQLVEADIKCPVAFLQNGLRICENLEPKSYEMIESVVDFNTVYNMEGGKITLTQAVVDSALVLDGRQSSTAGIAKLLSALPLKVVGEEQFVEVQCGKLLKNLTNAVNALSGEAIRPMLMQAPYRLVLTASMEEAKQVLAAQGIFPKAHEHNTGGGDRFTSMAQDMQANRFPTEIDFLNGEIVRMGQKYNVPTPVNEKLISLVKDAEAARAGSPMISGEDLLRRTEVPTLQC